MTTQTRPVTELVIDEMRANKAAEEMSCKNRPDGMSLFDVTKVHSYAGKRLNVGYTSRKEMDTENAEFHTSMKAESTNNFICI